MQEAPFRIDRFGTTVTGAPEPWRERFNRDLAIGIPEPFAPDHLADLMARAARADFVDDHVINVGDRAIEARQRIGAGLSLMLHDRALMDWVERATGTGPLRALAGQLAETRANGSDELTWHDDLQDPNRLLAVVINLSEQPFSGGSFELRRKQTTQPHLVFDHDRPGSMLIFAVRPDLEHRVTPVTAGGPRRVFAGWFLSRPEHETGSLASEIGRTV